MCKSHALGIYPQAACAAASCFAIVMCNMQAFFCVCLVPLEHGSQQVYHLDKWHPACAETSARFTAHKNAQQPDYDAPHAAGVLKCQVHNNLNIYYLLPIKSLVCILGPGACIHHRAHERGFAHNFKQPPWQA